MPSGRSVFHKHPDYRVDLDPNPKRTNVRFAGEVVADSAKSLHVRETQHAAVVYFPRDDVRMDLLERTDHSSHCPFKGDASYWTIRAGGEVAENAVWSYEDPFEEVAGLKDYLAFYADRTQLQQDD